MDYFAGLDISMDETHICVVDRDGAVVYEGKSASTAGAIADKLSEAPSCRRIVFETGRMAPILFHGLSQLGLPAVCVESRQAYQALKSIATHKTDRNDARGLAHLARTGFFKPVYVGIVWRNDHSNDRCNILGTEIGVAPARVACERVRRLARRRTPLL
jgi:transposase